eukprot:GHVP01024415.1.p1 GENE.GHVP01024415.1~~GHVP01024415.1.p1  ORF type:complete len:120 (+),score=15.16 GHVP01024415.1:3-362(+)
MPLGVSPFYALIGQDIVLPGVTQLMNHPSEKERQVTLREQRIKSMLRHSLKEEDFKEAPETEIAVGDLVLYELMSYEQLNHAGHPNSDSTKMLPNFQDFVELLQSSQALRSSREYGPEK